uniref:Amidase domain-containing protein n=1 Tax=Parastrongyloides trichosuri TaxID=131310 RepID=A0A0N4ZVQ2_PARTI
MFPCGQGGDLGFGQGARHAHAARHGRGRAADHQPCVVAAAKTVHPAPGRESDGQGVVQLRTSARDLKPIDGLVQAAHIDIPLVVRDSEATDIILENACACGCGSRHAVGGRRDGRAGRQGAGGGQDDGGDEAGGHGLLHEVSSPGGGSSGFRYRLEMNLCCQRPTASSVAVHGGAGSAAAPPRRAGAKAAP